MFWGKKNSIHAPTLFRRWARSAATPDVFLLAVSSSPLLGSVGDPGARALVAGGCGAGSAGGRVDKLSTSTAALRTMPLYTAASADTRPLLPWPWRPGFRARPGEGACLDGEWWWALAAWAAAAATLAASTWACHTFAKLESFSMPWASFTNRRNSASTCSCSRSTLIAAAASEAAAVVVVDALAEASAVVALSVLRAPLLTGGGL